MVSLRTTGPGPARRSIVGLDILRFCAAMLVVAFHIGVMSWTDPHSEAGGLMAGAVRFPEFLPISRYGWIGVPMFFVLSGFVIAFSAQGSTAARFLESRVLRLMPGIWICATLTFGLALAFSHETGLVLAERYLKTLVVFPAPRWIDGVYWTLSIEMAFYALVWALLMRRRFETLEPIMIALGLFSAGVWAVAATGIWPPLDALAGKRLAQLLLVTHGCEFALGVLVWRVSTVGWSVPRALAASGCLAGTLLQVLSTCREVAGEQGLAQPFGPAAALFLGFFALFVAAIACNALAHRLVGPRGLRAIRLLGLATYPLYLMHTFVGVLALRAAHARGASDGLALLVGLAVAIGASLLVARFAEPWLRRRLALAMSRLRQAASLNGGSATELSGGRLRA